MMTNVHLDYLETEIRALPLSDQLWLLERMVRQMRNKATAVRNGRSSDVAVMAADPEIQRELREIEAEFAGSEGDGLSETS